MAMILRPHPSRPHGRLTTATLEKWCFQLFTPEQDNDKTNVEPVHSYDAFHTRHVGPGTDIYKPRIKKKNISLLRLFFSI